MLKHLGKFFALILIMFSFVLNAQETKEVDGLRLALAENANDTTAVNHMLGIAELLFQSDPDSAMIYSRKAIGLAEMTNYKKGLGYGYKNLGLAHYVKGEYSQVLEHWEKSLSIFQEINDASGISNLLNNIGAVYQTKGDDPRALDYFIKSVRIAEEIQDSSRIGTAYLNIGTVYSNAETTYKEAFESYLRAQEIFGSMGYDVGVGTAAVNIAELHLNNDNPEEALKNLRNAIEAYKRGGFNLSTSFNFMGEAYKMMGNLAKARQYHTEAIIAANEQDAKLEKAKAHIGLGEVLIQQKEYPSAIENFKESLALASITGVYRDRKDAYFGLAEAYSGIRDYQKAYDYQKLYSTMSDTLRNDAYEESIGNLRFQFDLENKEREIELLNKDNELKQIQIERSAASRKYYFAVAILLLAILAGILFQYFYIKKSNARLAKERNRAEQILLNILPKETAEELKEYGTIKAKYFEQVTVLFTDFKNFSIIAENIPAKILVKSVDYYFKKFDEITVKHNLEKIKTIGDSYMCAGGLPTENKTHPRDAYSAASEMLTFAKETEKNPPEGIQTFEVRFGINTGPVVAGVVGTKKFQYDIWGSTVNIASRMESNSLPGKINVSENTYQLLKDDKEFTYRGIVKAKNNQKLKMYFVEEEVGVPAE